MMRTLATVALLLSLCGGLLLAPLQGEAPQTFTAKVVGVVDGDTLKLLKGKKQIRVRLWGVDCPEKRQPFGSKAKEFTSDQVFGKVVTVEVRGKDRYRRSVATLRTEAGDDLTALIIEAGLGWWNKKYAPKQTDYERLEQAARAAKRGLWSQKEPLEPWKYRKR